MNSFWRKTALFVVLVHVCWEPVNLVLFFLLIVAGAYLIMGRWRPTNIIAWDKKTTIIFSVSLALLLTSIILKILICAFYCIGIIKVFSAVKRVNESKCQHKLYCKCKCYAFLLAMVVLIIPLVFAIILKQNSQNPVIIAEIILRITSMFISYKLFKKWRNEAKNLLPHYYYQ